MRSRTSSFLTSSRRWWFAFAGLLLLAAGCAKEPIEEIAAAEAALQDARDAGAPRRAPEAFAAAEAAMTETYRLVDEKEYDLAREKAIETRRLAERARDLALAAQRRQRVEEAAGTTTGTGDGGTLRIRTPTETAAEIASEEIGGGALDEGKRIASLEPVYFDFDDYAVRPDQVAKVEAAAKWLLEHPDVRVRLEGHTDERGAADYNLALGGRRAESVRRLLVQLGVPAERIETHSYGEEMPADLGHDEAAWAKNRRVEFVLLPPSGG